jgi:hypothetical protein
MDNSSSGVAGPAAPARPDYHPPHQAPAMSTATPASAVPLRLSPAGWEDVLDALGTAAERAGHDIDCDTCTTTAPCARHDGGWARVDRWRSLAVQLRAQFTAAPAD